MIKKHSTDLNVRVGRGGGEIFFSLSIQASKHGFLEPADRLGCHLWLPGFLTKESPRRPKDILENVQTHEWEGLGLSPDSGTKAAKGLFIHSTNTY